jgi:hypothetical protein
MWAQDKDEVTVSVAAPPGTRAAQVVVEVEGGALRVGLRAVAAAPPEWLVSGELVYKVLTTDDPSDGSMCPKSARSSLCL